jgi:hypothetical protein
MRAGAARIFNHDGWTLHHLHFFVIALKSMEGVKGMPFRQKIFILWRNLLAGV